MAQVASAADRQRLMLEHYNLSTSNPIQWPEEKDHSDASEEEEDVGSKSDTIRKMRRSQSKYSALTQTASDRRSFVPGSQKLRDGGENLVQTGETDPLGVPGTVVQILKRQGVATDDVKLRNRFLLSSTTFSPSLFLSQVHSSATTTDLDTGLDLLNQAIDQKSASLKVLVEDNFERFVRAKQTIDNVYTEMRYRGIEPPTPRATHSRHASRSSFRTSGNQSSMITAPLDSRKKNALTKESEYGVLGIKSPLLDVSAKAEEVWGPAMGGKEKEESLKILKQAVDQYRAYYEIPGAISEAVKERNYDSLVEQYTKSRRFAEDAKQLAEDLRTGPPNEVNVRKILLAARIWHNVTEQVEDFKREVWRKLSSVQNISKTDAAMGVQDQHMELISILLELGVKDNPIWVWLLSRFDCLLSKIQRTSDNSRVEIEILRRNLANGEEPTSFTIASHLRTLGRQTLDDRPASVDAAGVIELWEKSVSYMTNLLSAQGILGEVLEFWQTVQSFTNGEAQKTLPRGIDDESVQHHQLTDENVTQLQEGVVELVEMITTAVSSFFSDPPIEDISALFSPMPPQTPRSPRSPGTPGTSARLTPTALRFVNLDPNNLPPPSPRRGNEWEKYAFWPPWSNSMSGAHYLAKLLVLIGTGACEMASISPVGSGDGSALERLKTLVIGSRERCVNAICAAWNSDAKNFKHLEDWRRSPEKRDVTRMPAYFGSFQGTMLAGMQKILYIPEAKQNSAVITPPPAKLLMIVRSQYVTTLYKALSGMFENAEKTIRREEDDWTSDKDGLASPVTMIIATSIGSGTINSSDRNVRLLLTLSNFNDLRTEIIPSLSTQFENAFSVKLTDESVQIRDALRQIYESVFKQYIKPALETIRKIIRDGVADSAWPPAPDEKPTNARPYIYDVLLSLVLVHNQISTTAASLMSLILSTLLESTSTELLEAFKRRQRYNLSSLMQATLDVEFVAQTLSQYATAKGSEIQSQIYQELDRGTDPDARVKLQDELPEMRAVLKRLREGSRSEFQCFKKEKRRPRTSGQAAAGGSQKSGSGQSSVVGAPI